MKNKYKQKRLIFLGAILISVVLALFFIITNFKENIVFFYSPTELKNLEESKKRRQIRIGGLVKENSIKKIDALNVEFIVTDLQEELKVHYHGILPDLFREQQGVVASGKYDDEKKEFFSSELLIKHDEKYMPPEVAESLKKIH